MLVTLEVCLGKGEPEEPSKKMRCFNRHMLDGLIKSSDGRTCRGMPHLGYASGVRFVFKKSGILREFEGLGFTFL